MVEFAGSFAGEREGQYPTRIEEVVGCPVGDSAGENTCLSRPSTGTDDQLLGIARNSISLSVLSPASICAAEVSITARHYRLTLTNASSPVVTDPLPLLRWDFRQTS